MIDFQGLLNVVKSSENKEVDMNQWAACADTWHCGTHGCLIGNFCLTNIDDQLRLVNDNQTGDTYPRLGNFGPFNSIAQRFNITLREANWLFGENPLHQTPSFDRGGYDAVELSGPEALSRLRKFIYYKLHKQEMEYETGRNKELVQPRNISGRNSAVLAAGA